MRSMAPVRLDRVGVLWGLLSLSFLLSSLFLSGIALPFRGALMSVFVLSYVVAMTALFLACNWRDPAFVAFAAVAMGVVLFLIPPGMDGNDDKSAYLVFGREFYDSVAASLQPLSERRMFNVGAGYVFQAPVLHWLGNRWISFSEPGPGFLTAFVILSVFSRERLAKYAGGAVLVLCFLAGWRIVPNTAPSFMMLALVLGLLFSLRDIAQAGPRWSTCGLLWVCAAYLCEFRSTLAVFIFLALVFSVLLAPNFYIRRFGFVLPLACLGAFLLSAMAYAGMYGTLLYPVLGRGIHVTSAGLAVNQGVGLSDILIALLKLPLDEPAAPYVVLAMGVMCLWRAPALRFWIPLFLIYLANLLVLVHATGGWAFGRYLVHLSVAMLVVMMADLTPLAAARCDRLSALLVRRPASLLLVSLCALGGMVTVKAEAFAALRAKMFTIPPDQQQVMDEVTTFAAQHPAAKVLLVQTVFASDVVPSLKGRYLIMDMAGMVDPSRSHGMEYGAWLAGFLKAEGVGLVVMSPKLTCGADLPNTKGWRGLTASRAWATQEALCAMRTDYEVHDLGRFTLMTRRSPDA